MLKRAQVCVCVCRKHATRTSASPSSSVKPLPWNNKPGHNDDRHEQGSEFMQGEQGMVFGRVCNLSFFVSWSGKGGREGRRGKAPGHLSSSSATRARRVGRQRSAHVNPVDCIFHCAALWLCTVIRCSGAYSRSYLSCCFLRSFSSLRDSAMKSCSVPWCGLGDEKGKRRAAMSLPGLC